MDIKQLNEALTLKLKDSDDPSADSLTDPQDHTPNLNGPQPNVNPNPRNWWQKQSDSLKILIKKERITKGWSQRELANQAQLSQATITRAECHLGVSLFTLMRITNALGKQITLN